MGRKESNQPTKPITLFQIFCLNLYILNKSKNVTLQLTLFCEKVLDRKY